MNKKFLSAILFGALMVTSTGTFVSCKDYDEDIENLQSQVDQKASLEKLSALEGDLAAAKSEAAAAKAAAEKAADAAEAARQEAKIAAIEAVEAKVATLTEEINATINASKAEVEELAARIDTLVSEALGLIGNRLTSVALIPTTHINGIPAITVHTLKYTPQVYTKNVHEGAIRGDHSENPWLDHTDVLGKDKKPVKARYISSNDNEVKFHLNPSLGVTAKDILLPSFDCIVSENYDTRAVDAKLAYNNSPIMPTPGQEIKIEKGVLTLKFQKSQLDEIGTEGNYDVWGSKEKFYMASLKVPVAEANWTEAEKADFANGVIDGVYVNSEYNRVEEIVRVPYLTNSRTFGENVDEGYWNSAWFANEQMKDDKGIFYVHYHDSICLYNSKANEMVDVKWEYKKPLDLKTLVDVCTISEGENQHWNHEQLKNYKAYGLEFRFELAAEKYIQGANKTNEQEFATINNSIDGIMTSRVYEVGEGGTSRAAIGREPIVRVSLIDTNNDNALVAQRYIKVQWTDAQVEAQEIAGVTFPDAYVSCKDMFQQLYTKDMNEKVYHLIKVTTDGGTATTSISKENFHNMYNNIKVIDLKKDGVSILKNVKVRTSNNLANGYFYPGADQVTVEGTEAIIENTLTEAERLDSAIVVFGFLRDENWNQNDNQSNNIVWAMSPKAVGALDKDARASKFEITVQYQDANGMHGAIQQTFTQNIVVPAQNFNYQGTYWKNGVGEGTFNVNPIVYNTNNDGKPANKHESGVTCEIKDYSHIEADLINGYLYAPTTKRPANLGEFIQYIRSCADVRFVFDADKFADYEHLAGYKVVNGTELWKVAAKTVTPTLLDEETGANHNIIGSDEYIFDYVQEVGAYKDSIAATINNFMGATAETNKNEKKTLPWNWDEELGTGVDQIQSVIRLHEKDAENGTYAAIGLIGKDVPVKLLVAYNKYNVFSEQEFDVHFIDPLAISDGALKDSFVDAVIDGDFLSVAENFQFTDWNGYAVASATVQGSTGKEAYAHELYDYYAVKNVVFATDKVTTSLTMQGDTYIHKDGVKDGKLPTNASLKQMNWVEDKDKSTATEVSANPTHLAYFNNEGTPVNVDYQLFVDVQVQYKWGVLGKTGLPVWVKTADGVKK